MRHLNRNRIVLAAVVAAAALVPAASAAADSIVYIDGGNVWSAAPDRSRKVQLTDGGDWHSPTQADDGTIAAVKGTGAIQLMARDGRPLHTIQTETARSGDGGTFAPHPVELSLSPDGTRLAYSYVANSCPIASTCGEVETSTFYTYTNVTAATPQSLFGEQFNVSNPEWIGNDRVLLTGGYGSALDVDDLAGGGDSSFTRWVKYPAKDMADAEVSRDGRKIAYLSDYGANTKLYFDLVNGDAMHDNPPPATSASCAINASDAAFSDPSWSPDSMGVAFRSSDGIDVLHFRSFGEEHCESAGPSTLLSATGSEPDWGPADPPAARYSAPATTPAPAPAPAPSPAPARPAARTGAGNATNKPGAATPPGTVSLAGTTTISRRALRAGRATLTVAVGQAGTVTVTVKAGGTTIATATKRATAAGRIRLRLPRPSRRAAAKLAHARAVSAQVTLRSGAKVTARAHATVKFT